MSRNERDQRGGHPTKTKRALCGCCTGLETFRRPADKISQGEPRLSRKQRLDEAVLDSIEATTGLRYHGNDPDAAHPDEFLLKGTNFADAVMMGESIHPTHVFIAGRCLHCNSDDHSLPNTGMPFAAYELPCPVPREERITAWAFDGTTPVEGINNAPDPYDIFDINYQDYIS